MLQQPGIAIGQEAILFSATGHRDRSFYYACKRCVDVLLAAAILLLVSPLMLLVAIMIKLDSSGPAIFVQERVGARRRSNGTGKTWEIRNFPCYKFRTMVQDADPTAHQAFIKAFAEDRVESSGTNGAKFKMTEDPRVTRVGRMLRRTSVDELPQLMNVLRGDMSLVGPRPVPTYEVAEYRAWHRERLAALPGITGLWQVNGRSQVSFDDMIRMDIDYVRSRSLWLDVRILLLTLPAVLAGRGAQ
jgi:lipopolysaccharide/colanic/teichoic acid biosynthesis glycosyltransferase